jgi:DNA-binding PucR family transcriptional regulator
VLTLRALADDPRLRLRTLVTGDRDWTAPVRWVHNTELADPSPYLRADELVMTNGVWCQGDDAARTDAAEHFVRALADAGAAGMVFGLRREVPQVPAAVVRACRRAGMALLELPITIPFTAISQAAAGHYSQERQHDLLDQVRRNNALVEAISRGAGAAGVLDVLGAERPELAVCVVDRLGRIPADRGVGLTAADGEAVAAALGRRPPPLELELGERGPVTLFLVPTVGAAGIGAVLVCRGRPTELSGADLASLEQAARFLSLEVAREELSRSVEARFAGELLELIASGAREEVVAERLRAFGVDAAAPMAVCALAARTGGDAHLVSAEAVVRALTERHVPAVVAESGGEIITIFPWPRPEPELITFVRDLVGGTELVAGLSGVARGIGALRPALREARESTRVLRSRPSGPRVRRFDELGGHRLLLGRHDAEGLRAVAAAVLDPLRRHDAERGSDLVPSLQAFLDHDGNWNATATHLSVHVNTLRNRLTRVTELTGLDVARTADRVDLFLALEADRSAAGAALSPPTRPPRSRDRSARHR